MSAATAETQTWTAPPPDSRRWTALAFIAIAQLMIALDATIVSIALPSAQSALGASDADRQWVVTAYALAFGGLLLLGGKVADYAGRKRAFLIGLAGFAVASAIGGAAPNFATLVAARALQGAFAALLAPTALALLAVGGLLLALFVIREALTANPLLPLRILTDRNRGGSYITVAMAIAGMFGAFLFLTYSLQVVLQFAPLQAGLAFLPMTIASQAGSWLIASRLMPYVAPRALMAPGAAVAAAGMALLTQLRADSAYLTLVLPAEVLLGLGISCVMVPAFSTATHGIDPREAGVASATVNTAQQIGGSLGTALLNSIAISATAAYAGPRAAALVHGFSVATGWGVVIL